MGVFRELVRGRPAPKLPDALLSAVTGLGGQRELESVRVRPPPEEVPPPLPGLSGLGGCRELDIDRGRPPLELGSYRAPNEFERELDRGRLPIDLLVLLARWVSPRSRSANEPERLWPEVYELVSELFQPFELLIDWVRVRAGRSCRLNSTRILRSSTVAPSRILQACSAWEGLW